MSCSASGRASERSALERQSKRIYNKAKVWKDGLKLPEYHLAKKEPAKEAFMGVPRVVDGKSTGKHMSEGQSMITEIRRSFPTATAPYVLLRRSFVRSQSLSRAMEGNHDMQAVG